MNLARLLSFLTFTLLLNACGQKPEAASSQITPVSPAAELTQKPAPATEPKAIASKTGQNGKTDPVKTESSQTATPANPAKPQSAQDAIEEVNQYGRDKTGTQVSKARDRAQAAEDEMMRNLGKMK